MMSYNSDQESALAILCCIILLTRSNHRLCSAFAMLAIEEHATTRLGCVLLPLSARIVYSVIRLIEFFLCALSLRLMSLLTLI